MKYLLLIYTPENITPDLGGDMTEAYYKYTTELAGSGKLLAGEALEASDTATTVTVRDGKTLTTDGPFAETNEVLGGFYMVDATDLDDAIAWAAKIPGATIGKIEVRPVHEFPEM
jgi:hypothetical protein